MRKFARIAAAAIAFNLGLLPTAQAQSAGSASVTGAGGTASVVLVHGAFADGSDWAKVIALLEARGVRAVAVQNPLTSLEDDVAAARRAIAAQPGKIVLVGHSWGGTVITEAGVDEKVAALVYIAALAPDAGQASAELGKGYPPSPGLAHVVADQAGFLTLSREGMVKFFAPDLPLAESSVMAATQGAIHAKAFQQKVTRTAWSTKPSWYVVSTDDKIVNPDLQRAMAAKIGARMTALAASHVPQRSQPEKVAAVILSAVDHLR